MTGTVRQLVYRPADAASGPIELLGFADLRRTAPELRRAPQRPDFNVLAIVRSGHGRHRVDFADAALDAATLVWIRPGQVNQWLEVEAVEGDLILFTATAVGFTADTPACWSLRGRDRDLVLLAADHLRAEYDSGPTGPILRDLLTALLRRATLTVAAPRPSPDGPAQRFWALVEEHLVRGVRADVVGCAAQLGYSARTVNRAVGAAAGVSAKTWLDQRTALEAKRLLVHSGLSAAACGRRLGFDDPANFSAFFVRTVGDAPARWHRTATST